MKRRNPHDFINFTVSIFPIKLPSCFLWISFLLPNDPFPQSLRLSIPTVSLPSQPFAICYVSYDSYKSYSWFVGS